MKNGDSWQAKVRHSAYLGSSFAYIAPMLAVQTTLGSENWIGAATGAIIAIGIVYTVVALILAQTGSGLGSRPWASKWRVFALEKLAGAKQSSRSFSRM